MRYRFPSKHPRSVSARMSVAEFKVLANLGVRHPLEARGAKSGMREERREFKEREAVCREDIQRIAQQLICTRTEVVQAPTLFKDLSKFCDPDEIWFRIFEGIEAH